MRLIFECGGEVVFYPPPGQESEFTGATIENHKKICYMCSRIKPVVDVNKLREEIIEECALRVGGHWNDGFTMVNQRKQAEQSAESLRLMKGESH